MVKDIELLSCREFEIVNDTVVLKCSFLRNIVLIWGINFWTLSITHQFLILFFLNDLNNDILLRYFPQARTSEAHTLRYIRRTTDYYLVPLRLTQNDGKYTVTTNNHASFHIQTFVYDFITNIWITEKLTDELRKRNWNIQTTSCNYKYNLSWYSQLFTLPFCNK